MALQPFQTCKLKVHKVAKEDQRRLGAHTPADIFITLSAASDEKKEIWRAITPSAIPPPSWHKASYANKNKPFTMRENRDFTKVTRDGMTYDWVNTLILYA